MATVSQPAAPPPQVAKVFMSGRSQAVRLPKAFRFNTSEVTIEKVGNALVLRPKLADKEAWWAEMDKVLADFQGMPEQIERDHAHLSDPVSFD